MRNHLRKTTSQKAQQGRDFINALSGRQGLNLFLAMISLALTVAVGVGAYLFHVQDVNRGKDQEKARVEASQAVRTPLCWLVYIQTHGDDFSTSKGVQIAQGFAALGVTSSCPLGIKPPFYVGSERIVPLPPLVAQPR